VTVRRDSQNRLFKTDEGNLILDSNFGPIADPHALAHALDSRTGIVAHGLFLGMATDLLVASDSEVLHQTRPQLAET
jgi:ribose 5-phosphate isomerase A